MTRLRLVAAIGFLAVLAGFVIIHEPSRIVVTDMVAGLLPKPIAFSTKCWFPTPKKVNLDCYHIYVRKNRDEQTGTIRIPVVVFRAQTKQRHPKPVQYIAGGPHAILPDSRDSFDNLYQRFESLGLLDSRDVILFDYRGTGRSLPSLRCDDLRVNLNGLSWEKSQSAMVSCIKTLRQPGSQLTVYNTLSNANDVIDIWTALDLDDVDLIAESYGSRVAMEALALGSSNPQKTVLVSPLLAENSRWDYLQGMYIESRVFEILGRCASDAACSTKYGDLAVGLSNAITKLKAAPISIPVEYSSQARWKKIIVDLTPEVVVDLLIAHMYTQEGIARIPRLVDSIVHENVAAIRSLLENRSRVLELQVVQSPIYYLVHCNDMNHSVRFDLAGQLFGTVNWAGDLKICPEVLHQGISRKQQSFPIVDDSVLVLSGDLDPITPTEWAVDIAARVKFAELIVVENATHDVLDSSCGRQATKEFLGISPMSSSTERPCSRAISLDFL